MGSSHGSAADVVSSSGRSNPGGDNVLTWGKDVDNGAIVGEGSTSIANGGCADSGDLGDTSGGGGGSVSVGVTSCNSNVNSVVVRLIERKIIIFP